MILESDIQKAICQYLDIKKIFYFSVPNEAGGKNAMLRMKRLKSMGLRSGVSDLVLLLPECKVLFIEVKSEKGKQSENQIIFQEKVQSLGHEYYVVKSVKELQGIINNLVK